MLLAAIFVFLFVIFSLVILAMTAEPMGAIKKNQPDYYKSFGISLYFLSPFWIGFTLFLALGEYKNNVKCSTTIEQLGKARPFAILQLLSFAMFIVTILVEWINY